MPGRKLRIVVLLSGGELASWRAPLVRALKGDGHEVAFANGPVDPEPRGAPLLRAFERLVYRASQTAPPERPATGRLEGAWDLYVTGGEGGGPGEAPKLDVLCDGRPFALGVAAAVLEGRAPQLAARLLGSGASSGAILSAGVVALEEPHLYGRSLVRVADRAAQVAAAAVRRIAAEGFDAPEPPGLPKTETPVGPGSLEAFAWRALAGKVDARLKRLVRREDRWRIAWRPSASPIPSIDAWGEAPFRDLADDGGRYYADPFLFTHEGRAFLLCEEFPYATGVAILSAVELVDGRPADVPRPILERPYHLSYPMVFAHEGAVWMIPESSAANRIELYRAERFPDRWTYVATLVDGVGASDATILKHEGRLWLFATEADPDGSSWDRLCLWSAESLTGPWAAHPKNPVLIDASCARPAGMPVLRQGEWLRPAQDCTRLYGGGLAWCSIDRLDEEEFAQRPVARLTPPPGTGAIGVHTVNLAVGLEIVDLFGPPIVANNRH